MIFLFIYGLPFYNDIKKISLLCPPNWRKFATCASSGSIGFYYKLIKNINY